MDAIEILAEQGIHLKAWRAGQHYMPCPRCSKSKSDQNLSVLVRVNGHAKWKCWRCGNFSGCTEAVAKRLEWRERQREYQRRNQKRAAAQRGPGEPGSSEPPLEPSPEPETVKPVPPHEGSDPEHRPFESKHQDFWDNLEPITRDCPVGRYLTNRCCGMPPLSADLCWHPDFGHFHQRDWRGPVMIGLITSAVTGEPLSFHFTWVREDGSGKAPVTRPRLMAKAMAKQGGVVRLFDDGELMPTLIVGEGVESTLSAQNRWWRRFRLPGWACIDAGNLKALPYIEGVTRLIVLIDNDKPNPRTGTRAGGEAFDALHQAWSESPCEKMTPVWAPRRQMDVNNLVAAACEAEQPRKRA